MIRMIPHHLLRCAALALTLSLAAASSAAADPACRFDGAVTEASWLRARLDGTISAGGVLADLRRDGRFRDADAGGALAAFRLRDGLYLTVDWNRFRQAGDLVAPARVGGVTHPAAARLDLLSTGWHALLLKSWLDGPGWYLDAVAGAAGARHELALSSALARSGERYARVLPQLGFDAGRTLSRDLSGYLALVGTPGARGGRADRFLRVGVAWRLPTAAPHPESDRAEWRLLAGYEERLFRDRDGGSEIVLRRRGPRAGLSASF